MWRRVSCPAPEPAFGIAAPQGRETPAGAGCWVLKRSCLPGGSESARCPALRSAGLFGSETGSPRARAVQGTGIPGVPNISSQRKCWGGFRGGGRRAEPGLRTSRQKELAAAAAKKPSPPGPSRHKKKACQGSTLPVLGEIGKTFVCAKTPTRGDPPQTAHPKNPPHTISLRSIVRGPRVRSSAL